MTKRCGWCGRFVSADTLPEPGYNAALDVVTQLLCPDCLRSWKELSEYNIRRYQEKTITNGGGTG